MNIKGTNKIDDNLKVNYKVTGNDNSFEIKGSSKRKMISTKINIH